MFDTRIAHSLRSVSPTIRKWTEVRRRISPSVNIVHGQRVLHRSLKSRGSTCLSILMRRTDIWADLTADRGWKERRFSAITGFKLHPYPFKYSRDEYFLIVTFGSTTKSIPAIFKRIFQQWLEIEIKFFITF